MPVGEGCWYNMQRATVAQLAEQPLRKRRVKGSTPFGGFAYKNKLVGDFPTSLFIIILPVYQLIVFVLRFGPFHPVYEYHQEK